MVRAAVASRSTWSKRNIETVERLIVQVACTAGIAELERAQPTVEVKPLDVGPASIEVPDDLDAASGGSSRKRSDVPGSGASRTATRSSIGSVPPNERKRENAESRSSSKCWPAARPSTHRSAPDVMRVQRSTGVP